MRSPAVTVFRISFALLLAVILAGASAAQDEPAWITAMRRVHAGAAEQPKPSERGVLLHLGDSITYSMAYFAPLQSVPREGLPDDVRRELQHLEQRMQPECYRWKGPAKGNHSGKTAAWALQRVDRWLDELRPEVAVVMFGSNDIRRGSVEAHARDLRALIRRCLERGVVVILSTIPPMDGYEDKVRQAVKAQRELAAEFQLPLIDFHAHVINRRPRDWNGAEERFAAFEQWEVPTLISRDGVHPSNPSRWKQDYSEQGRCRNGNVLRSYLTLMAYSEVVRTVFEGQDATNISHRILGPHPPRPESLPEILPESPAPSPAGDAHASARPPRQAWFPHAPALPAPRGTVLRVDSATALIEAAAQVPAGGTIMIAPGVYKMPQSLLLNTDDVSLRGASGQRGDVVLDFGDSRHHEAIRISACSGVTVADLTIANVRQNGLKINSDTGARRVTIHNLVGHNIWQRHVKGVKSPDREGQPTFVDDCRIQYCLFYNDRPKRRGDDPWEDAHPRMRFNYVGGIDVMSARNWQIRDNVFLNINGQTGEARGAIFLWQNSQGCRVERNVIVDCDSGICLGNSSDRGPRRHAVGCLVQNNFVTRCSESNLLADHTRDCQFLHNTVHDPQSRNGRLLRVVHANDGLLIAGNLFSGPRIVIEQLEGALERRDNLIRPVGEFFVDPEAGDLHLTRRAAAAIDAGRGLKQLSEDIDRQPRDRRPDLGADEWRPAKETADR